MTDPEQRASQLRAWLLQAPPGTLVPVELLARALAHVPESGSASLAQPLASWRERLWVVPPDTRLGVRELLETVGRTRSWLYRHTGPMCSKARIPHRKLDGELVFLAGEVRQWLIENEVVVVPGPSTALMHARGPRGGARLATR